MSLMFTEGPFDSLLRPFEFYILFHLRKFSCLSLQFNIIQLSYEHSNVLHHEVVGKVFHKYI